MGKCREDLGQQLQGSPGQRAESWPLGHVFNNCTVLSDPARYGRCLPRVLLLVALPCFSLLWDWPRS